MDGRIRQLSLEEWIDLPDDEEGEWADGWLVEEEVASLDHDVVAIWLGSVLLKWGTPRDRSRGADPRSR